MDLVESGAGEGAAGAQDIFGPRTRSLPKIQKIGLMGAQEVEHARQGLRLGHLATQFFHGPSGLGEKRPEAPIVFGEEGERP